MGSGSELVQAICDLIKASTVPIPITLMNHGVDEAAAIIGAVVERRARDSIALTGIYIAPSLAARWALSSQGGNTQLSQ